MLAQKSSGGHGQDLIIAVFDQSGPGVPEKLLGQIFSANFCAARLTARSSSVNFNSKSR
jgi:hypothetical protein